MIDLVVYVFFVFGIAYVVGHSLVTRGAREALAFAAETRPTLGWLLTLIECPACLGWWIGLAAGSIAWASGVPVLDYSGGTLPLLLAFFTAGTNFVLARLTGLME